MSQQLLVRIAIILAAILLIGYWLVTIDALSTGQLFAWETFWHAPVGSITALITLLGVTPLWVWAVAKFWNWRGDRPWRR